MSPVVKNRFDELSLGKQIRDTIEKQVKDYADSVVEKLADDHRARIASKLRQISSAVCIEIMQRVTMFMNGQELHVVIHDLSPKKEEPK